MHEAGDGRLPAEPEARRGLRDRPLGKLLLLAVVLLAAAGVARTCGSHSRAISQEDALVIARENADFTPCSQRGCVRIRAVQRGIPVRLVWIVGLAEDLDARGQPTRFQNFVIDAETGEIRGP